MSQAQDPGRLDADFRRWNCFPSPIPQPPAPPQPLTSDIIKVPSAEELKKGAKIETIKPEDIEKEKAKEKK